MRIIGIDPGLERTGFAIVEEISGKMQLLDHGIIFTEKTEPFSRRLANIAQDLVILLRQWQPNAAGIEEVFFSKNVKTAIKVSHARGVIIETLEEFGTPVMELNPGQIKISVCGDGRADKKQVQKMLKLTLGQVFKQDDAADAIACGICALASHQFLYSETSKYAGHGQLPLRRHVELQKARKDQPPSAVRRLIRGGVALPVRPKPSL